MKHYLGFNNKNGFIYLIFKGVKAGTILKKIKILKRIRLVQTVSTCFNIRNFK